MSISNYSRIWGGRLPLYSENKMKIEKQVVSLDLCKKLKEAGYPQDDSYYAWIRPLEPYRTLMKVEHELRGYNDMTWGSMPQRELSEYWVSAPTVSELGEKLPSELNTDKQEGLEIHRSRCEWIVAYRIQGSTWRISKCDDNSLADAMAEMWLYLKDKELL